MDSVRTEHSELSFMAGQRFEDFDIGKLVEGSYCQDGMPFENFVH